MAERAGAPYRYRQETRAKTLGRSTRELVRTIAQENGVRQELVCAGRGGACSPFDIIHNRDLDEPRVVRRPRKR